MKFSLFSASLAVGLASAQYIGFNYGNTFTNGKVKEQSDWETEFKAAKALAGTNGEFTSARLYTTIQGGTANTPIAAIPAAINTKTSLLLGLWASAGQSDFTNELTALQSAINQYGTAFTSLIVGISVGSEDLYRNSPTGIKANGYNGGADPDVIVDFIGQAKSAIAGTSAAGARVGHVDTWTAWVNGSNEAVIRACDWLGMDAYPYFQNTIDNSIDVSNSTFFEAYDNTVAVALGKEVWVTETGWPVSGPQENQAVASIQNAETYWQQTGCSLFGDINTWWYVLQDAAPTTPSPSFGIVGSDINGAPLYNLTCSNGNIPVASSAAPSSATSKASSASAPASSAGPNTESLTQATPAAETSPTSVTLSQTTASSVSGSAKITGVPAASSSSGGMTVSTATGGTTTVSGGQTGTVYQTTLITITSCPSGCSESASATTNAVSGSPATVKTPLPASVSTSATTPAVASSLACPANLKGDYQYPHLIVPVDKNNPNKAYGTQYNGTISPSISTIFNFDLPQSYAGKTCSLVFLFPEQAALETSAYTFNNQGGITVDELASPATEHTTYASVLGTVSPVGGIPSVKPGNSYTVVSRKCAAGSRVAFEFSSTSGLDLEYFQDWNPSPIGAYIVAC